MHDSDPIAGFSPEIQAKFSAIRKWRVAKYCMAESNLEKICPEEQERPIIRELLIRAHFDPDFRFGLIWNAEEALARIPGGCPTALIGMRFCGEDSNTAQEIKFDAVENRIRLMPPAWHNIFTREKLKAMIDSKFEK